MPKFEQLILPSMPEIELQDQATKQLEQKSYEQRLAEADLLMTKEFLSEIDDVIALQGLKKILPEIY